jgi:hypothetical protein
MNLRRSFTLLAFAIASTIGLASHPQAASAACAASMPYTFTNVSGTYSTVDANTTNSNNTFLLACAKNVDNTQIGTAGIYASQIIPTTTGQATFGGSVQYQFPNSLVIGGASSTTGFGLGGAATSSYPILGNSTDGGINYIDESTSTLGNRWFSWNGTSLVQLAQIDQSGDILVAGSVNAAGAGSIGTSLGVGTSLSVGTSETVGTTLQVASGVTTRTSTNAYTQLLPVYLSNGSAVGNTWHGTFVQCTTSASNSCSVTLSGAGAFSSSTSWGCGLSANTSFASNTPSVQITSGTAVTLSYSGSPGNNTLTALCWGF